MESFIYVYVQPGKEPELFGDCDLMIQLLTNHNFEGTKEENLTGFEYHGAYILYNKMSAELNKPMNRFFQLDNGDIMAISGDFAVIGKNPDEFGYIGLTDEQQRQFIEEFKAPHLFVAVFDKLFVFEKTHGTELSLLTAIDIHEPLEEEE